jgi:hypothetical protein
VSPFFRSSSSSSSPSVLAADKSIDCAP